MKDLSVPVLGIIAWSGTGKTTLLTKLIPILKMNGIRVALIKHAHHHFDIDHPGKDSHRLRKAGADQIVIASKHRIATIRELPENEEEVTLEDIIANVHLDGLDLVLVEGFKMAAIPKIELHRQCLRKPYLYPTDKNIIALAHDSQHELLPETVHSLNVNEPDDVASFIMQWIEKQGVDLISNSHPKSTHPYH